MKHQDTTPLAPANIDNKNVLPPEDWLFESLSNDEYIKNGNDYAFFFENDLYRLRYHHNTIDIYSFGVKTEPIQQLIEKIMEDSDELFIKCETEQALSRLSISFYWKPQVL